MNKKAFFGMLSVIITATVLVVIVAGIFIPSVKDVTNTKSTSQNLEYFFNDTVNSSYTLTNDDLFSLSISGLILNTNYTQDFTSGVIIIIANTTASDNYTASYVYYPDNYLSDGSNRALMSLLSLIVIVGLVYFILRGFGVL